LLVKVRTPPNPVTAAWYLDRDANGVVESVVIRFSRPVANPGAIEGTIIWEADGVIRNIKTPSILGTDASTVIGRIDPLTPSLNDRTDGRMNVTVPSSGSTTAVDSAAPVLTSAVLIQGKALDATRTAPDTLQLEFSEPVAAITHEMPINLTHQGGQRCELVLRSLSADGKRGTFIVREIRGDTYPQTGDWGRRGAASYAQQESRTGREIAAV
jgi:hypothetical protein